MKWCTAPFLVVLALAVSFASAAPQEAHHPELLFEELWQAYDLSYALFDARGIDWRALHRMYRPRVTSETSEAELFAVMSEMLGHLNDNHVMLISEEQEQAFCAGYLGRYINELGRERTMALLSARPLPDRYFQSPPQTTANGLFLYGWVADDVGYLHFPAFKDVAATAAALDTVLASFSEARGLIVDVRHNSGGADRVGKLIADRFADRRRLYMVTRNRVGPNTQDYAPPRYWHVDPDGAHRFTGPTVLLQNRLSVSAAENFALAMRVLPQVTVVGDFSSGCFADLEWHQLPNGWRFSIAYNRFDDYAGRCWEGIGVPPDILVRSEALEGDEDRTFEVALALVQVGPAPQNETASARAARLSLLDVLVQDFEQHGPEYAGQAFLASQRDLPLDSWFVDSDQMIALGQDLLRDGLVTEGLAVLDLHAQSFPDYMRAQYLLGNACLGNDQLERGLRAYDRALTLNHRKHPVEVDAFVGMTLRRAMYAEDEEVLSRTFAALRDDHPEMIDESRLNTLGYELLGADQVEDAIAVFRLNVKSFPQHANAYDSLGEAYMVNGNDELAIQNYEKSLALDPSNENAERMLARLRGE